MPLSFTVLGSGVTLLFVFLIPLPFHFPVPLINDVPTWMFAHWVYQWDVTERFAPGSDSERGGAGKTKQKNDEEKDGVLNNGAAQTMTSWQLAEREPARVVEMQHDTRHVQVVSSFPPNTSMRLMPPCISLFLSDTHAHPNSHTYSHRYASY